MNCPFCAEIIPDNGQFCPKCGTQMGSPLPDSPSHRQPLPPGFQPPVNGKAIGSLICGIFFLFLPASIAAVILGHLSLSEIRKSAGRLKGQGIATVGLVLGYLGVAAIPLILILAAIAIPNLLRAKMAANEASAVGSLRTYNAAIASYMEKCPQLPQQLGPGRGDCNQANLVGEDLASPQAIRSGYVFVYHAGPANNQGKVATYAISADPVKPNNTGTRHFFTDETGVIRWAAATPGGLQSQPIQ
jgi:type IV pilus assembly protein PilA